MLYWLDSACLIDSYSVLANTDTNQAYEVYALAQKRALRFETALSPIGHMVLDD